MGEDQDVNSFTGNGGTKPQEKPEPSKLVKSLSALIVMAFLVVLLVAFVALIGYISHPLYDVAKWGWRKW